MGEVAGTRWHIYEDQSLTPTNVLRINQVIKLVQKEFLCSEPC